MGILKGAFFKKPLQSEDKLVLYVLERTIQTKKQRFSETGSVVAYYNEFVFILYFQALSQNPSTAVDFYANARIL